MSRVRGKNTKPEIMLRKALWHEGYRYSLKTAKLPGKPDLILNKYKMVIFVDGCFWHRCPKHFKAPSSNNDFWEKKLSDNTARDKRNNKILKNAGWIVLRFWEHDVRKNLPRVVRRVIQITKK